MTGTELTHLICWFAAICVVVVARDACDRALNGRYLTWREWICPYVAGALVEAISVMLTPR